MVVAESATSVKVKVIVQKLKLVKLDSLHQVSWPGL